MSGRSRSSARCAARRSCAAHGGAPRSTPPRPPRRSPPSRAWRPSIPSSPRSRSTRSSCCPTARWDWTRDSSRRRGDSLQHMKAAQVVAYGRPVELTEVPEPALADPHDVIVKIAGAGICRTDLHILQGELAAAFEPALPYTLGHENAGWVHSVGPAVAHLAPGDPVIVHPAVTCGVCSACRAGVDMHCPTWRFPGVDGRHGGYAVLDLVGEHDVPAQAMRMLGKGGVYSIVGYGGRLEIEHLDMINRELTIFGNQIGSYTDLVD